MKIIHEGRAIAVGESEVFQPDEWSSIYDHADLGQREQMERIVREGVICDDDGEPFDAHTTKLLRTRLAATPRPESLPLGYSRSSRQPVRWLIPGLWRWGTYPMLGGNPKAGKSTILCDLSAALTVPGRRFLDHFEPADVLTGETRYGDEPLPLYVRVLNAENPPDAFEEELRAAGCSDRNEFFEITHLEQMGSPDSFDVTDPENYEAWVHYLTECEDCDGTDFYTPTVLLVDGLTAILGGDTDRYGEWYPAFRRLMREVGIPNALVTAHATLAGGHLMGGAEAQAGPDGLWAYSSSDGDNPGSQRSFSVVPRMGGTAVPPTRVHRGEDGRLGMGTAPAPAREQESVDYAEQVRQRLDAAGTSGLLTTDVTGRGREGQLRRQALTDLIVAGDAVSHEEGRATRYWLSSHAPSGEFLEIDLRD